MDNQKESADHQRILLQNMSYILLLSVFYLFSCDSVGFTDCHMRPYRRSSAVRVAFKSPLPFYLCCMYAVYYTDDAHHGRNHQALNAIS